MISQIEVLRVKLKSVTKLKLNMERNVCQIRNRERSLNDQLTAIKAEIENYKEKIEDMVTQIAQAKHQIAMIKICSASERDKMKAHVTDLDDHLERFQQLFDKERLIYNNRMKETEVRMAQELEIQNQREKKKTEEMEKEAAAVEAEGDAIEKECNVLKKRNKAVMLQLKRKLLEVAKT